MAFTARTATARTYTQQTARRLNSTAMEARLAHSTDRLPEDDPDVIDMHVERILAMTPEELDAEIEAIGEDRDRLLEVAKRAYERALAQVQAMRRGLS
ncbi:hypothetical protein [Methylobacterium sp. D54C]